MPYMLPLLNMQAPPQSNKKSQHRKMMMRTVSISILVMSLPMLYASFLHVPPAALFKDTTFWFLMSNSIIIVIAADSGMLFFGSSSRPSSSVVDVVGGDDLPLDEPADDVKNGHVASGVFVADEVVPAVENHRQATVLREQQPDVVAMVAENDDHGYALVLRDDEGERMMAIDPVPESRDIMVVEPPSFIDLAGEAVSVSWNEAGAMVLGANRPADLSQLTASRSLAARREERSRRRHGHRPSHSRALVPVQDKSVVVTEEKQQLRRAGTEERPSAAEEEKDTSEYSRLSDEELNRRVEEFITKFNREMRLQLEREQLAIAAA